LYLFTLLILLVILLIGLAYLTAVNGALYRMHVQDPNFEVSGKRFFYRRFHLFFFPEHEYDGLLFATIAAKNVTRFFYAITSLIFLFNTKLFQEKILPVEQLPLYDFTNLWIVLSLLGFILASFIFGDYIPRILGARFPEAILRFCTPVSSFFMLVAFPLTYICMRFSPSQFRTISYEEPLTKTKKEIIEIIQKTQLSPELNLHEKKLIESVLRFKDRIAREVMVPRVDVFSLSADTKIKDAAKLIEEEGYSRIPIYRNTVDNIVGVLMYKDILNEYIEFEQKGNDPAILEAPIESIQKNILYTPETKKISNLLLEFRKQQVHLAIVVDEYGGTEGIVTIEDILEEIVGEIADEYDEEEELFYTKPDGSWIVDARMTILDAEQQLGIKIPQEADYDTIGGYIFHCAGSIPSKGFLIHQEEFQIEILRSDERRVERVRIKPVTEADENGKQGENPEKDDKEE